MNRIWNRITNWELWPFYLIYTPLGFVWAYYAIKARAFWFFSNVNPSLLFSGFEGEGKKEMYEQMPMHLYPRTIYVTPETAIEIAKEKMVKDGLNYPVIAKPEIGMQGILFRKIDSEPELDTYHKIMPFEYVIQEYVDLPLEVSVFHIRYPGQTKGKVTGFILKEYMHVVGDGRSTLLHLIQQHPKAQYRMLEMRQKHGHSFNKIIPAGERYILSIAGNHNRGAKFVNLHKQIDQRLVDVFDNISNSIGQFYFGRYDLKCSSVEELKEGKNFSILEFNGAGAEPNHIYDCGMSYFDALKEVAKHWQDLYLIGRINKAKGIRYWTFKQGLEQIINSKKFFKKLKEYDLT
ncbi:MAG: hypothetical protein JWQ96_2160 [Segetibacter sp.]|nr:hypothetical protein [Segetibacter sp.]